MSSPLEVSIADFVSIYNIRGQYNNETALHYHTLTDNQSFIQSIRLNEFSFHSLNECFHNCIKPIAKSNFNGCDFFHLIANKIIHIGKH